MICIMPNSSEYGCDGMKGNSQLSYLGEYGCSARSWLDMVRQRDSGAARYVKPVQSLTGKVCISEIYTHLMARK
jgi:hypothetical protein